MKLTSMLAVAATAAALLLAQPVQAQVKIAYTSPELILANMPEARQVEQQLSTHQRKLQEQYNVKLSYYQTKVGEYQSNKQRGMTPEADETATKELQKLEEEIRAFQEESRGNLQKKQEELLGPLLERIEKAIQEVANDEGYTYVLNMGNGQSTTLLYAPPSDNISEKVLKKMGITIPAEGTASTAPATPAPGAAKPATPAAGAAAKPAPKKGN